MTVTNVATIATIGAIRAAIGIVVGSLPVTVVGPRMLINVAAVQIATVAPNTMIHDDRRPTSRQSGHSHERGD